MFDEALQNPEERMARFLDVDPGRTGTLIFYFVAVIMESILKDLLLEFLTGIVLVIHSFF